MKSIPGKTYEAEIAHIQKEKINFWGLSLISSSIIIHLCFQAICSLNIEDSELLCAKVISRLDIKDQYTLLSSRDLTFCPNGTGSNRVCFSNYTLGSNDRMEKEQEEPPLSHEDKLKPGVYHSEDQQCAYVPSQIPRI